MWRPEVLGFAAVAVLALGPLPALAQSPEPWVGRRVMVKYGSVLKIGDRVVDDGKRNLNQARGHEKAVFRVYRVAQTNGDWLWLVPEKGGSSGWIAAASVIPIDEAIQHFTALIRSEPDSAAHHVNRGLAWLETGEDDIAIKDFNAAIRLDPKHDVPYINRGRAWWALGEHEKAIADLTEAIRLDPKHAVSYKNRGAIWREMKAYDKAVADLDEAIRLDPHSPGAHVNRAWCWAAKEQYDKAWDDFNAAIHLEPGDAYFYTNRAWFAATCRDPKYFNGKRTVATATRACELGGWKDPYNLGTLAAAHAASGDFEAAVKWQEQAQTLYDDEKDRKDGLARLELYKQKKPFRVASNTE